MWNIFTILTHKIGLPNNTENKNYGHCFYTNKTFHYQSDLHFTGYLELTIIPISISIFKTSG